ncbi:MAG: hypothetical protein K0Q95_1778 [Bacteroidota bacterium]|jgi:hypothetical protein|nr:hypothetical protein [Bacteroidota bacterium]
MKARITLLFFFFLLSSFTFSQETGIGIGIYPTGSETGLGFRSSKNSRLIADVRIGKAAFFSNQAQSSFMTEVSAVYKVVRLEKVRFHLGLGFRTEWNFGGKENKYGGVMPIGVEAFPFPFQNAGLIFEVAPYYMEDFHNVYNGGLRTLAGFIFYFPFKEKKQINTEMK